METISSRVAAQLGFDPHDVVEMIRDAYGPVTRLKSEVEYLDDYRKVLLAEIMEDERKRLTDSGEKVTESRLENAARMHPKYARFLADLREQKRALGDAEATYYALRNRHELALEEIRFARSEAYLTPR